MWKQYADDYPKLYEDYKEHMDSEGVPPLSYVIFLYHASRLKHLKEKERTKLLLDVTKVLRGI